LIENTPTSTINTNVSHDAEVEQIFGSTGPLSNSIAGYRPRQAQTEMAKSVAAAIAGQKTLLAEAGTGTGKTYAYLTPALLWGGKVIVSTGTKNLQDQLFLRDIPMIKKVLRAPVSVALLKGRANYLCHYHLERTLQNGRLSSREDVGYLRDIARFIKTTSSGDKSELSRVPENASVWSLVTSTKDTCMGSECQYYQDCFVMKARKEAQQADVVVVNHHLFFADVALKDTGIAELLPSANTVIFDEAHQLPETATLFLAKRYRPRKCWSFAATFSRKAYHMPVMVRNGRSWWHLLNEPPAIYVWHFRRILCVFLSIRLHLPARFLKRSIRSKPA
jgi:ATP-dependent DNA helicase DinG